MGLMPSWFHLLWNQRSISTSSLSPSPQAVRHVGCPGAFTKVLPGFLEDGKLFFNSDWRDGGLPIGKPTEARQDKKGLWIRGRISSTPKGETMRILLKDGVLTKIAMDYFPDKPVLLSHEQGRRILGPER